MNILKKFLNFVSQTFLKKCSHSFATTLTDEPTLNNKWQQLFNGKNLNNRQHVGEGEFIIDQGTSLAKAI